MSYGGEMAVSGRPVGSTTARAEDELGSLLERLQALASLAEAVESRYIGPQPKNAGAPTGKAEVGGFFSSLTDTVVRCQQQIDRIENVLRSL